MVLEWRVLGACCLLMVQALGLSPAMVTISGSGVVRSIINIRFPAEVPKANTCACTWALGPRSDSRNAVYRGGTARGGTPNNISSTMCHHTFI